MLNTIKLIIFFIGCFFSTLLWAQDQSILLKSKVGKFNINPNTLQIYFVPEGDEANAFVLNEATHLGGISDLDKNENYATWQYPNLNLDTKVKVTKQGLHFEFTTHKAQSLVWPTMGLSKKTSALIIPSGEGLYIPSRDPFWLKMLKQYPVPELSMPFSAIQNRNYFISIRKLDKDLNTVTQFRQSAGQLYFNNTHYFDSIAPYSNYDIYFDVTKDSPLGPAFAYRDFLIQQNNFVSLKQKLLENPDIHRLFGAFHLWVWGNGKSLEMLDQLDKLGVKHLWIGYDATPIKNSSNVDKDYITTAKNMGYLIGPYDSFDNAQDPKTCDSLSSLWPGQVWPDDCIQQKNGKRLVGFAHRGCYLSSEALQKNEEKEKILSNQVTSFTNQGDNSLFLDCDAAYPLYRDYAKNHAMSPNQDLENRLERMRYISSNKKLVLGSETGLSWSIPVIAFNNGGFLAFPEAFWHCLKDKQRFGKWWPDTKPAVLFKSYTPNNEFLKASYDPYYRLPLYEAAFHDAVISTDRWEMNELKVPALKQTKALLQNLYQIPPIWVLDLKTLKQNQKYFTAYYDFFSPLHELTATEPLTSFSWLSTNHLIQQTEFGNRVILVANFSNKVFDKIPPGCIQAKWKEDDSTEIFCPLKN